MTVGVALTVTAVKPAVHRIVWNHHSRKEKLMLPHVFMTFFPGEKQATYVMRGELVDPLTLSDYELALLIRDSCRDPIPLVFKRIAAKTLYHRHNGWVPEDYAVLWNINSIINDLLERRN